MGSNPVHGPSVGNGFLAGGFEIGGTTKSIPFSP
ncbi:hypothetical protein E2C01_087375 [Portunus trituberculatus]|uniref:Uncharacterized protein n=1 Tax=Portunus trituberculatus TaxID=210409 RepID=A0A5B7JCB3_PORTR|nr:hypothetical protein [Portunus trituberculatus]